MSGERTLLVTTSYPRFEQDFAGHFVRTHARQEASAGRSVRVLAFGTRRAPTGPRDESIEVVWLGGGSLFGTPGVLPRLRERRARAFFLLLPLVRALWALRERRRFDRVVAHFLLLSGWPLGVWFARRGRAHDPARLEVVAHGSDVRLFERLPSWLRRRVARDLAQLGASVRFVSAELRSRMALSLGSSNLAAYVEAQPARALPLELPDVPPRAAARRALGIQSEETVVLVVGRLTSGKRVDVALSAATLLPDARVVVIGDGPENTALRRSHPDARFLGSVPRIEALRWLVASDLLVSASRLEGAPTAIREARILGVPVVSTSAGDLPQWSERDRDLWLVD